MRLLFFRSRTERSVPITSLTCTVIAFCAMLGTVLSISGCGGGSDDGGSPTPILSPSPAPSTSPIPTPIQKSVSFDVTWGSRTRGGFNASSINSAQSAQFSLYEGADRSSGPQAVIRVNRDANGNSYTATYSTGTSTLNARRVCLVDAIFYPLPDQNGVPVAGATMQSSINLDSGKLENAISLIGEIKNVSVLTTSAFVGETTDVSLSTTNQFGTTIPVTPGSVTLAITTGADNLALIGGTGPIEPLHIRGIRPGTATITATVDGATSPPANITIDSHAIIVITPADAIVSLEKQVKLSAVVSGVPDGSGADSKNVTWSVITADGGSVTPDGVYTAPKREGNFVVQAQSVFDPTKKATVTVKVASGVAVVILPDNPTIGWQEALPLTAQVSNTGDQSVTWVIDGNNGKITADGIYTSPKKDGTYTIIATSNYDPRRSGQVKVNVVSNTAVAVTPATANLSWLESIAFQAQVTHVPETDKGVSWTVDGGSSNGTITNNGFYTAPKQDGTYTVVATSLFDNRKIGTATVTVTSEVGVKITPDTDIKVNVNDTKQFAATVTHFVGEGGVTWSVEPDAGGAAVGTITPTGLYTAPSKRQLVYIRATSKFDPSRFARVPVQVTAGGADVTVE